MNHQMHALCNGATLDAFPGNLPLQVATRALPQFREGAWLVELAPIRDPSCHPAVCPARWPPTSP